MGEAASFVHGSHSPRVHSSFQKTTHFSILFFPVKAETCGFLLWDAFQRNTESGFQNSNTWQICMEMRYVYGLNIWHVTREASPRVSCALSKCKGSSRHCSKESGKVFRWGLLRGLKEPGSKNQHSHLVVCPVPCAGNWNVFCLGCGRTTVPQLWTASKSPNSCLCWFSPSPAQHRGDPAEEQYSIWTKTIRSQLAIQTPRSWLFECFCHFLLI